jgi:hypothetical protein
MYNSVIETSLPLPEDVIYVHHTFANPSFHRLSQIWVRPESSRLLAPVLDQLRHLNMDLLPEGCDIAWTMLFLEAAPSLDELRAGPMIFRARGETKN